MIKPKYVLYILVYTTVIISGITYFNYSENEHKRVFSNLVKEYPPVTLKDSLKGYISEIHQPYVTEINNHPHQAFVTFAPGKKHLIMVGLELSEKQLTLDEVLTKGDYVLKKAGSNRIEIIRLNAEGDSVKFSFNITDFLGYPAKE